MPASLAAIPALEYALRLSPRDNRAGNWCGRIGVVHLLQSQTDEAILWLEKAGSINPALPFVHAVLASAYALEGDTERAAAKLREARNLGGGRQLFDQHPHGRDGVLGGAEDPRPVRSDLSRRPAHGRDAGGARLSRSICSTRHLITIDAALSVRSSGTYQERRMQE